MDIEKDVKKTENDYTFYWLGRTIREEYLPDASDGIRLLNGVNKKDDAILTSTSVRFDPKHPEIKRLNVSGRGVDSYINVYNIEIADSRMLNVLVSNKGINQNNILDVFKTIFKLDSAFTVELQSVEKPDESTSFGKIKINTGDIPGYYKNPVEWYQNGKYILFVFDKILTPWPTKGEIPAEDIVGGIPYDDQRPYLRFKNANRKELSQEYYQKYFRPESEPTK